MGMDSLMAVDLRNRLKNAMGPRIAMPATLFFDFPNLNALADYLIAQINTLVTVELPRRGKRLSMSNLKRWQSKM